MCPVTREVRLSRALVLLIFAMTLQPLFALGCIAMDDDGVAPPARGTALFSHSASDDDEALEVIFGGDPGVVAGAIALPLLELRAGVAGPAPAHILPRFAAAADHPPRPA